jgi:hypothetical protein
MKSLPAVPVIALTPKGALIEALGWEQGRKAWSVLSSHAKRQIDYREERGTPAVVLQGGGEVIATHRP